MNKRSFSFEFKLEAVRRFLAGETKLDLARELGLSSPKLIETWARTYRNEGEDGLRPKRQARWAVLPGNAGKDARPRTTDVGRRTTGPARRRSGTRVARQRNATSPSIRASGAPRQ